MKINKYTVLKYGILAYRPKPGKSRICHLSVIYLQTTLTGFFPQNSVPCHDRYMIVLLDFFSANIGFRTHRLELIL